MKMLVASLFVFTAVAGTSACAQTANAAKTPAYDVMSVRPSDPQATMVSVRTRDDTFLARNVSLLDLVQNAYGISQDRVAAAPPWAGSARFDLEGKILEADPARLEKLTAENRREMLRAVLEERFHLKVHRETKTLPVYELVIAKGGSKMKPATPGDVYANGLKDSEGVAHAGMMKVNFGQFTGQGILIAQLTDLLHQQVHRTVIDETGLNGRFDVSLKWTPEQDPEAEGLPPLKAPADAPLIFTSIQEQLGLKLQPAKGPVDTLVIDHAEKPAEN